MSGPRRVPIHTSLCAPVLLLGAERELVLISGLIAAVLVLSLARIVFAIIGIGFWIVTLAMLRRAARFDRSLSAVYLRHLRYRPYYPAQSPCTAPPARVHQQLP